MRIGVLGTGVVGTTIASKLVALGHDVKMGSRSPTNEKAAAWVTQAGGRASQGTFADAATHGEIVFNCTVGTASLDVLKAAGAGNLKNKIIADVSNPLDFSKGMPPTLFVSGDDSLAERIQRAFPDARVVKTLNTITAEVMVNPDRVKGDHDVFLSGNDASAKGRVTEILRSFGWTSVVDLGDLTTARATESYVLLWLRLWGALKTPVFNIKVVR